MLKTKQVTYRGFRFRSTLEGRWAYFLDLLGVPWEYEKEAYDLDGLTYIPDFWLPTYRAWVEIKGDLINDEVGNRTIEKCKRLACLSSRPVILAYRDPLDARCAVFGVQGGFYADARITHCPECGDMAVVVNREGRANYTLCQNKAQHTGKPMLISRDARRFIYEAALGARQARFGIAREKTT